MGLISGLGRFPGGRNGNPLQYSCLDNPLDRGTWWATVHGVTKSQTQLSTLMNKTERYLINFTFHIKKLVKKQCKPKVGTRKEIIEIRVEINQKIEKKNFNGIKSWFTNLSLLNQRMRDRMWEREIKLLK